MNPLFGKKVYFDLDLLDLIYSLIRGGRGRGRGDGRSNISSKHFIWKKCSVKMSNEDVLL